MISISRYSVHAKPSSDSSASSVGRLLRGRPFLFVCLCVITGAVVGAQSADAPRTISFDTASIKENRSGEGRMNAPAVLPSGRFSVQNAPLRYLIEFAYDVDPFLSRFLLVGGSESVLATRFDVTAVALDSSPGDGDLRKEARLRLRALLAERFSLRTHAETRSVPVFALTPARTGRLGPQLHQSMQSCLRWRKARAEGRQMEEPQDADGSSCRGVAFLPDALRSRYAGTMADLMKEIQFAVERPLEDKTGLTGDFEWTLTFANPFNRDRESSAASIFAAMQEQLGLKLEPQFEPMDVRVIDSVSMPTPN
jgi:uncharacterized protein (TIGR03435 family)